MTAEQGDFRPRVMKCDWCGFKAECCQWQQTHYMICLACAVSNYMTDKSELGDGDG